MRNSSELISVSLYQNLRDLIQKKTGILIAGTNGRTSGRLMLQNRLTRPMQRLQIQDFEEYYRLLQSSPDASSVWIEFVHAVSTHKTAFFREQSHFDHLIRHAKNVWMSGTPILRVWSTACSTGEEAYSAAISLLEASATADSSSFLILASDIDEVVLEQARDGIYPIPDPRAVPRRTLERHFLQGQGKRAGFVRVKDDLRQRIRFSRWNLLDSNYPERQLFHAIFCRNVLIYFDIEQRNRIVTMLTRSLAPGGLLFLGHSESFSFREDLENVAPTVYRLKLQENKR